MAHCKGAGGRNVLSLNVFPEFFQYQQGKSCKCRADCPCEWGEQKELRDTQVLFFCLSIQVEYSYSLEYLENLINENNTTDSR